MKKDRIVIASILKPVDDTRMYEKMAVTLEGSGEYEVFVMGYPSQCAPADSPIHLLPSRPFPRLSFARVLAPLKIFKKIYALKPAVLIVGTHELLHVAVWIRILLGTRIVYDVRENYYRNILYARVFPWPISTLLAVWVRLKEELTSPFFHAFILAEQAYSGEMKFFGNRAHTIENKALTITAIERKKANEKTRLLFSGTLAESTGIFKAIMLAIQLNGLDPSIELTIIGYCASQETLEKIKYEIEKHKFISLVGGHQLVPHPEIQVAIYSCDFGIICYPSSPHTESSIPTKLYEYLSARLPILLQDRQSWIDLCNPSQACIPVNFDNLQAPELLSKMRTQSFYSTPPQEVTWEREGRKLLELLAKIKNP
jgi:hypothetical protein